MSTQLVDQHIQDLTYLYGLAESDLLTIWLQFGNDAELAVTQLKELLPELVDTYGNAAAALGADWYDEMRGKANVPGRFTAVTAPLPDKGRTDSLAAWASRHIFTDTPDFAAARDDVAGGLQRIVTNADRDTVMGSSIADPNAHGWRRSTSGRGCSFCRMVAGRNIIFSSSAGRFACHDHCMCIATPVWGDGAAQTVETYTPTERHISAADRARVRQWLKDHPDT